LAYLWSHNASKKEEAHSFLENGLKSNPTSFLLNFAYGEYQEQTLLTLQSGPNADPKEVEEKKAAGHKLFKDFTGLLKKELDDLEAIHIASGGTPVSQQSASAAATSTTANPNTANNAAAAAVLKDLKDEEEDIAMKENEIYGTVDPSIEQAKERERERQRENERREARLIDKRVELGLACIAWMRYAKRIAGTAGMRNIFKEVRADKWVSWQVFEAAGNESLPTLLSFTF
jgi:cleavage stimulation factor subunit 3